jgi:hypothetical protein
MPQQTLVAQALRVVAVLAVLIAQELLQLLRQVLMVAAVAVAGKSCKYGLQTNQLAVPQGHQHA